MQTKPLIFVGAGFSSLLMAAYLIKKGTNPRDILIIEKSGEVGGQFTSRSNSDRLFDQGMHIYYETGIDEIDSLFVDILPENQWHFLVGNQKDVAGIFWNNRLQVNTAYPDLRKTQFSISRSFYSILTQWIKKAASKQPQTAEAWFFAQFGRYLSVEVYKPIIEKLYKCRYQELDAVVAKLTALNRVALFGEKTTKILMNSSFLRSRIAYPEQRTLPDVRVDYGRGVYPKNFGMGLVAETLADQLVAQGVEIWRNSVIHRVEIGEVPKIVSNVEVRNLVTNQRKSLKCQHVFWMTVPILLPEGIVAKSPVQLATNPQPMKKYFINLVLDQKPNLGDTYYVYVFDQRSNIFRITNYAAYCPDAQRKNRGYPITVEYWSTDDVSDKGILEAVVGDLNRIGVCKSENVDYIELSPKSNDFPTPYLDLISSLRQRYDELSRSVHNIHFLGPFCDGQNFFLHETLVTAYNRINEKVDDL
jgi:protoporphyrinogen oxidase